VHLAASNQTIEALALSIKKLLVVSHPHAHSQTILHVTIEIDQVWVDVIQQRLLRLQTQHNCKPTAKRFDITSLRVDLPDWLHMRDEPAFAASPLQRRLIHREPLRDVARVRRRRLLRVATGDMRNRASAAMRAARVIASPAKLARRSNAVLRR